MPPLTEEQRLEQQRLEQQRRNNSPRILSNLSKMKEISLRLDTPSTNLNAESLEKSSNSLKEGAILYGIVGRYNSGKSTFINALLNTDFIPVSSVPQTAIKTIFRYGEKTSLKIFRKNGEVQTMDDVENIRNFQLNTLKNKDQKDQIDQIEEIHVYLPSPLLVGFARIVDTRGIGEGGEVDKDLRKEARDYNIMLFVTDVIRLVEGDEKTWLEDFRQSDNLFILVNQRDIKDTGEWDSIFDQVMETTRSIFTTNGVYDEELHRRRVFLISARDALANGLENGGMNELKEEIEQVIGNNGHIVKLLQEQCVQKQYDSLDAIYDEERMNECFEIQNQENNREAQEQALEKIIQLRTRVNSIGGTIDAYSHMMGDRIFTKLIDHLGLERTAYDQKKNELINSMPKSLGIFNLIAIVSEVIGTNLWERIRFTPAHEIDEIIANRPRIVALKRDLQQFVETYLNKIMSNFFETFELELTEMINDLRASVEDEGERIYEDLRNIIISGFGNDYSEAAARMFGPEKKLGFKALQSAILLVLAPSDVAGVARVITGDGSWRLFAGVILQQVLLTTVVFTMVAFSLIIPALIVLILGEVWQVRNAKIQPRYLVLDKLKELFFDQLMKNQEELKVTIHSAVKEKTDELNSAVQNVILAKIDDLTLNMKQAMEDSEQSRARLKVIRDLKNEAITIFSQSLAYYSGNNLDTCKIDMSLSQEWTWSEFKANWEIE
ncbi:dynamin family protein (plasmid) [Cyanobacterium sp. IPPAS B-1200]|uniref:dynamin family protein n=1 Tax=Cyanobacterium sp. IPPAS B-1200 TaxID=1562720 RepID=UPI0008527D8B|nr:dynamin family protein [Cyanobacterium sp. IPPAS B-1200]OEJ78054.1 hypothetical protein A5482_14440 [Cyanobacterium sp. IPPAS B-1200]